MKTLARLRSAIRSRWRWLAAAVVALIAFALWLRLGPIARRSSTSATRRHGRRRPARCAALRGAVGDGTRSVHLDADEPAADPGGGDARGRGSPLLVASRRRPARCRARARQNLCRTPHRRGRLDDHAAGREAPADPAVAEGQPRGVRAKVREAVLALRLEHRFAKREILAPLPESRVVREPGRRRRAASQVYFGADAVDAHPGPGGVSGRPAAAADGFNPWRSLSSARAPAAQVLRAHGGAGALDVTLARRAPNGCASRAGTRRFTLRTSSRWLRRAAAAATCRRGSRRRSTPSCSAMSRHHRMHRPALAARRANVAVVVLDNATGEWLAWEGSGDYGDADTAARSTGRSRRASRGPRSSRSPTPSRSNRLHAGARAA